MFLELMHPIMLTRNVTFKRCYNPQLQPGPYFTSLYLSWCFSCIVENVTFTNFGILGENVIGHSYLNAIYITHNTGQFRAGRYQKNQDGTVLF